MLVLTPLELIDKIAALVPPPRAHRHRYYGVLAPNAPLRAVVTALAPAALRCTTFGAPPAPASALTREEPRHRAVANAINDRALQAASYVAYAMVTPVVAMVLSRSAKPSTRNLPGRSTPCARSQQPAVSWLDKAAHALPDTGRAKKTLATP